MHPGSDEGASTPSQLCGTHIVKSKVDIWLMRLLCATECMDSSLRRSSRWSWCGKPSGAA
jgi:hypothetical protein